MTWRLSIREIWRIISAYNGFTPLNLLFTVMRFLCTFCCWSLMMFLFPRRSMPPFIHVIGFQCGFIKKWKKKPSCSCCCLHSSEWAVFHLYEWSSISLQTVPEIEGVVIRWISFRPLWSMLCLLYCKWHEWLTRNEPKYWIHKYQTFSL